jgi:putative oligomerization/nucleic acid binding protein/phospholipase D-like protein
MDDFGLWDVIVSIFWFMLLIAWFMLLFRIVADIFGDRTLSGGGKAGWTILIVLLPWLGTLIYLIARGGSMHERALESAQAADAQMRAYVRDAAGTSGTGVASELRHLTELRDAGTLTPEEYAQAKAKVLT